METDWSAEELEQRAKQQKMLYKNMHQRFKKMKDGDLQSTFENAHAEAFEALDCLDCARCCKTISPRFENRDIERLAKHFKLKPGTFIETHLRMDEDQDYVVQQSPCPFLNSDNTCSVYEVRPKACRQYPHTDHKPMRKVLSLTFKNASICPIVYRVLNNIQLDLNDR